MIEILWHGRGGQGAFTAARLCGASAALRPGAQVLAFPSFGPERRGAPMRAFTKIADAPIGDRSASAKADVVVYLDETLFAPGWEHELKPGGRVLINTQRSFGDARVLSVDADGISREFFGRAIPNIVFLGALASLCPEISVDHVREAIRLYMPPSLHEKNLAVIDYVCAHAAELFASSEKEEIVDTPRGIQASGLAQREAIASDRVVPTLRSDIPAPEAYGHTTCWEAGFLVAKNAGWRSVRPVIDEAHCTRCLACYLYCPDGTICKVPDASHRSGLGLVVDYDFCKGCGICARACRFGAISMVSEHQGSSPRAAEHHRQKEVS